MNLSSTSWLIRIAVSAQHGELVGAEAKKRESQYGGAKAVIERCVGGRIRVNA